MERPNQNDLKRIVKINLDAYEGYKTAADNTNDSLLNTFFNQCANERHHYALELAKEIGISSDEMGTDFMADMHRVWIDLKTAHQKFNAKTVLNECERGEKYALKAYEETLEGKQYPTIIQRQLEAQQKDIQSKYERIQKLKKEYEQTDEMRNKQTSVP